MARKSIGLAILVVMLTAACGGSGATVPPGSTATTGGGNVTPGPASTVVDGAGGLVPEPCGYLSAEEVMGIVGTDPAIPITPTPAVREVVYCNYYVATGQALSLNYVARGAELYELFLNSGGEVETIAGIGDRALWSQGRLLFLVGDLVVYVDAATTSDAQRATSIAIGTIVAARMTGGSFDPALLRTAPPAVAAQAACELLAAEEAAPVLGQGPIAAQASEYTPQFCTYSVVSSSTVVLTVFLQRLGGRETWDSMVGSLTTEPVAGVGEKAIFEPSTNILFVLDGDALINVNVLTTGISGGDALAQGKALMQIMLGHL